MLASWATVSVNGREEDWGGLSIRAVLVPRPEVDDGVAGLHAAARVRVCRQL